MFSIQWTGAMVRRIEEGKDATQLQNYLLFEGVHVQALLEKICSWCLEGDICI